MSRKQREALEKFSAVDLSRLKFPLDGDSSAIYNSDKKEITIPYWMVAMLLNEIKVAQDMAKSALADQPRLNCEVYTDYGAALRAFEDDEDAESYEDISEWLFAEVKGDNNADK